MVSLQDSCNVGLNWLVKNLLCEIYSLGGAVFLLVGDKEFMFFLDGLPYGDSDT
jgi:hypothetical protein